MFSLRSYRLHVLDMRTRMPFRYGIASMTALPHLFVRVEAEVGGKRRVGLASEGLPPKWFTKDPQTTFRADLADMFAVIRHACALAAETPPAETPFAWWKAVYDAQMAWGAARPSRTAGPGTTRGCRLGKPHGGEENTVGVRRAQAEDAAATQARPSRTAGTGESGGSDADTPKANGFPPLLAGLGASLVERAAIDAFCRTIAMPFPEAVRTNALGVRLDALHPELAGLEPGYYLPTRPLRRIVVRHTVGLADPLTDADIPAGERLDDGLPQSLEACVRAYGLTHFKVKLYGDLARDIARLRQIATALESAAGPGYAFTLDGNEQYGSVAEFADAWRAFGAEPSLRAFMPRMLFVEQPLHRDVALSDQAARELRAWRDRPPIIIDESDGEAGSAALALAGGYAGASHKNCKGVFRGIANACLVAHRRKQQPQRRFVISGEDLANVGPVALLQDLAAMAALGIEHVERNGHHYFRGLSMLPADVQSQVLELHGDLYRRHSLRSPPGGAPPGDTSPDGFPTLDVRAGRIEVGSVVDASFGTRFLLDSTRFTPLEEWRFETLGVDE